MKKLSLILLLLALYATSVHAQLQKHDFKFGIGLYSSSFLEALSDNLLIEQGDGLPVSKNIDGATGAIYFTYKNYPVPKLAIGATIGMERVKGDIMINSTSEGRYNSDFFAGAIETDYMYVTKPHLQLYSGLGLGVAYWGETNTLYTNTVENEQVKFIYQLNIFGIRVGSVVGFFVEAGYGYKGMIKTGINIQL